MNPNYYVIGTVPKKFLLFLILSGIICKATKVCILNDSFFMRRCVELARLGSGYAAPNPMVGAVLVHDGNIIGEGYHEIYGGPHAEVNCVNSVSDDQKELISKSCLYVSLEPCNHFGKTPPCTDLIFENKIPEVAVGCVDKNILVSGKGIQRLREAGMKVSIGILEEECTDLNKRFFTFQTLKRPYIILKWAQTMNGFIGLPGERLHISNAYTNVLNHKWRSEEQAILIGKQTALADDPLLNNRYGSGRQPLRIVLCHSPATSDLKMFSEEGKTIVFNTEIEMVNGEISWKKIDKENYLDEILSALYQMNVQSILVEGGTFTLQQFFDNGLWDECRIITNTEMQVNRGIKSPVIPPMKVVHSQTILDDSIQYCVNTYNNFVAYNRLSDYF